MSKTLKIALIILLLMVFALSAHAQSGARLAFVNSSGQLVVSSGDGGYRWIITNPGEVLVEPLGYTWAPDGENLFFGVNLGGTVSLRVASVNGQSVTEIGQIPQNGLSGGEWTPAGDAVVIASNDAIRLFSVSGGVEDVVIGQSAVASPYTNDRPNLPIAQSVSPSGDFLLYQEGSGRYALYGLNGGAALPLDLTNDFNARQSGLWSSGAPLVAYWGYSGSSVVAVTQAAAGETVALDSGRSAPITPLAWVGTRLIYRGADGTVRLADLACLPDGCAGSPLDSGVELLNAAATEVQTDGTWVYYLNGAQVEAVNLNCVSAGSCLTSAVIVGTNAAPRTLLHTAGGNLVYTAYAYDANNVNDREVRAVNVSCVSGGACSPQTVLTGAAAGLLSPDGRYVVVEGIGSGLSALDLSTGTTTYLSDAGAPLLKARWG